MMMEDGIWEPIDLKKREESEKEIMIIWDYNNQEHIIRIDGVEQDRLRGSDIAGNIAQIERKVKKRIDGIIASLDYHFFLHLVSKVPLHYMIWLGSSDQDPGNNWWED